MTGLMALIKVGLSKKAAGLAASHIIKNGAVALSPWAIRCLLIPGVFGLSILGLGGLAYVLSLRKGPLRKGPTIASIYYR